jgi:hypothetical protein
MTRSPCGAAGGGNAFSSANIGVSYVEVPNKQVPDAAVMTPAAAVNLMAEPLATRITPSTRRSESSGARGVPTDDAVGFTKRITVRLV